MSELLIQYQTFAQIKQLCYSQKRGGLNFLQRFWSVTMETRILYRLIMFFPALDKSQLAGFTEAKYDISDRLEGKIFRIWLKIPKTLAKFKWDGKWGPMKSAIFTKMAPEFDKDGFVGNWNHASENRGSSICDAASFVTARLRREISFWAVLWRTQTHEDEFFFLFLNRNFSKLACGPQEFNSREIHLHLTF